MISSKIVVKCSISPGPIVTTFLKSILSSKSEYWPQMNALFPNGFELSNELSNLKILVTVEPEAGFKHVHLSFKFVLITFSFCNIYLHCHNNWKFIYLSSKNMQEEKIAKTDENITTS